MRVLASVTWALGIAGIGSLPLIGSVQFENALLVVVTQQGVGEGENAGGLTDTRHALCSTAELALNRANANLSS